MRDGHYLRTRFHSGYSSEGYVYERDLWLKKGLVLTDDNRALFRSTAFYIFDGEQSAAVVDGEPLYTGPSPDFLPDEPLPWFPFCVDGLWGYGDNHTGEVMVKPQWAFCDHFIEHYARFSAKGDFSDLNKECYDGAWGLYDGGYCDDPFTVTLPPVYQHLSCVQDGVILAKKDGVWGALDGLLEPDDIMLPFIWSEMYFAQSAIVAGEKTAKGPRYSIFSNYWDTRKELIIDGLTTVTVPEGKPYDGADFSTRLVERDGRWGVLTCPRVEIIVEPTLSREAAEEAFWECEGRHELI